MNWDDLRILLAVARAGGMLGAARRLGLDHTTVARRITSLEAAVGAGLVERSPRGARLTEAGARLAEHAERVEAELLAAGAELAGVQKGVSGAVRLATPEAFGAYLVAPNAKTLHARHPGLELELAPQAQAVSLTKREADLAVSLNRPPQGRLIAQKLTDYRLGLYASRAYLDAAGPVRDLDDLRSRPMVWYIDALIDVPELRYLDQVASGVPTVFRSSSIAAQQAAVASGLGVGVLHRFAAEQDSRLVPVLADAVTIQRSYWLVLHADLRRTPRVRAVVDFLHDLVREHRDKF